MNDLGRVHRLGEHLVEPVDEVAVVDEAGLARDAVARNEGARLLLGQVHAEGADAGAELGARKQAR